jgi:hypothetical protein
VNTIWQLQDIATSGQKRMMMVRVGRAGAEQLLHLAVPGGSSGLTHAADGQPPDERAAMTLQLGSYSVEGAPGAPGWRGVGPRRAPGTPDRGDFPRHARRRRVRLAACCSRRAASVPRPQVVPLVDLVDGPAGSSTPSRRRQPAMPLRLAGGAGRCRLLARMAETIAALHADGIFHGALRDWWRDDGGKPVLVGIGFAWLLAGQRFGRFEEGFARDREQLEQLRSGGPLPTLAPLPGADAARRTVMLDRGAALAGCLESVAPLPGERRRRRRSAPCFMPGGSGGGPAPTELLPTGSGSPPVRAHRADAGRRRRRIDARRGAHRAAADRRRAAGRAHDADARRLRRRARWRSGGVPRTELLPTGPPSSAARSAVAAPAAPRRRGRRTAARATPRPAKRKGRLTMYLGLLAVLFVLVLAGGGAWWWLARQRAAAAAAAPAADGRSRGAGHGATAGGGGALGARQCAHGRRRRARPARRSRRSPRRCCSSCRPAAMSSR